jgi:HTH-type transcriptional regulator/antitoxin HigA
MINETAIHSDLPIPPGEYLEEVIGELGMTKDELAQRMSRPATKLSAIFKGEKAITPDTALQLEKVVGVPAHVWTGLEAEYRLTLARLQAQAEQDNLKEETPFIKAFCYSELAKLGAVPRVTKGTDKVLALQKFFGVTSLNNVSGLRRYAPAYRTGLAKKEKSSEAVTAWLRLGELQAARVECAPFNRDRLKRKLNEFRSMTVKRPEEFMPELKEALSGAGIALVLCPHLPKTYAHGAVFPLGSEKTVMMLTIRGTWADTFWFSLFHELGHILLHKQRDVIVEYNNGGSEAAGIEQEADRFARDTLIPTKAWAAFVRRRRFYANDIQTFAHKSGIHTGIVVGRLQHENLIDQGWHNKLRIQYTWAD